MNRIYRLWPAALLLSLTLVVVGLVEEAVAGNKPSSTSEWTKVKRGRYLVNVAGCNDCHTPAFMQGNTDVPESERLIGGGLGFSGPWGTSYPWNLRLMVQRMAEKDWLTFVQSYMAAPPMPSASLRSMSVSDLSAIYAYLRFLGPAGKEAPTNLAPGVAPSTPFIDFSLRMPQNPVPPSDAR